MINKISEIIKKYNLKEIVFIFIFSLFLFLIFYGKQDQYLIDVGRETYIPWQILEGKVLYKDIFNVYGPLGYQINALAYGLLGINLNTLYILGFFNSILISFTTYYICKLFVNNKISTLITCLTISVCSYARTLFNFIFMYSYSAVYSLSSLLLSLLALLLYIKNTKNKYLYLSFLFAGFSFANKIEYLPYFALIFILLPFITKNKKDWKVYLYSILCFFAIPTLSFGTLILQGANINDFLTAFQFIRELPKTPAAQYFYSGYGLFFNANHFVYSITYLINIILKTSPYVLGFYVLNLINKELVKNKYIKTILNISILIFTLITTNHFYSIYTPTHNHSQFRYLGILMIFFLLLYLMYLLYKKIIKKISNKNKPQDTMIFILLLASICASIKGLFSIILGCYGAFSLAALFIPFGLFITIYPPKIFKFINPEILQKTIVNTFTVIILLNLSYNLSALINQNHYPIKTERGLIFVSDMFEKQSKLIKYIKQNTPEDATIVVAPEGAIINFLSNRKSNSLYYYLIPVNLQLFGEEKILIDFQKNSPDYFIINNLEYTPYNVGNFCDYAKNICSYINENYYLINTTEDTIKFKMYKKKQ